MSVEYPELVVEAFVAVNPGWLTTGVLFDVYAVLLML